MSKHITYSIPQAVHPCISGPFKLDLVSIKRIFFLVLSLLGLISCLFICFFQRTKIEKKKIWPSTKTCFFWSNGYTVGLAWKQFESWYAPLPVLELGDTKIWLTFTSFLRQNTGSSGLMAAANVLLHLYLYQWKNEFTEHVSAYLGKEMQELWSVLETQWAAWQGALRYSVQRHQQSTKRQREWTEWTE